MKFWPLKFKLSKLFLSTLVLIPALAVAGFTFRKVASDQPLRVWLNYQEERSLDLLFENISPNSAAVGAVIASPSKSHPNYYFHWVRDAGLVMNSVNTLYENASGSLKTKYRNRLFEYLRFSRDNQLTPNPSVDYYTPGLGEPKFNADGSAFNLPWMRPQNDGPALRTITLTRFANMLLQNNEHEQELREIYQSHIPADSVVKADLEFLSEVWKHPSFDLWEECHGYHFYTRLVQYKALLDGSKLADKMGDPDAADHYKKVARQLTNVLSDHWSENGYIRESFSNNCQEKPSQLDTATILAVLHTDGANGLFEYNNERILATAYEIDRAFQNEYPININNVNSDNRFMETAIGRYPGDKYNGYDTTGNGNPWVLAINAFAEYHYRLTTQYIKLGSIEITPTNKKFFRSLLTHESFENVTEIKSDQPLFANVISALLARGDSYVERNRFHGFGNGSFSEQINKSNGHMQGAPDLTWNYASFLTLIEARKPYKAFEAPGF